LIPSASETTIRVRLATYIFFVHFILISRSQKNKSLSLLEEPPLKKYDFSLLSNELSDDFATNLPHTHAVFENYLLIEAFYSFWVVQFCKVRSFCVDSCVPD